VALAACKELLAQVPLLDRFEAFEWTEELSTALFGSDEAAEGIAAFLERRPAGWIPGD
jgi:methylglutaconyl-CoA hydratase